MFQTEQYCMYIFVGNKDADIVNRKCFTVSHTDSDSTKKYQKFRVLPKICYLFNYKNKCISKKSQTDF